MAVVQRREFTTEFATALVRIELPFGETVELSERRQLEVLIELLQRALPAVCRTEDRLESDWQRWRTRIKDREQSGDVRPA